MAFRDQFEEPNHQSLRDLIYTPLSEALAIQAHRQAHSIAFSHPTIPLALQHKRTAVISRQVATPNYEMRRVISLAEQHDLNLIIFTYNQDKFISSNYYKKRLGKMGFVQGQNKHGETLVNFKTIVNFHEYDGKALNECITYRGESLVNFHQNILCQEFPQLRPEQFFDLELWFNENDLSSENHYYAYLKLFLSHAILFETFVLSNNEKDFTLHTFLPAFKAVYSEYGLKPLIVHSDAPDREGDPYWQLYPSHLMDIAHYDRRKKPRPA